MKAVYKELSVDDKFLPIKTATNQMSRWKDQLVGPADALNAPPGIQRRPCAPASMQRMRKS